MTPFDFLNEINYGKKDLIVDDIDQQIEKQYNPYIRKNKRFSKWHKAEKSELLEIVMEFYGYSIKRAKEVLPLLTTEDIEQMKIVLDKGGMKGVK